MNQQIKTGLGVIIILIFAVTAGVFVWLTQKNKPEISQPELVNVSKKVDKTANPVSSNVEGWQTYQNEKYRFEFKYPGDWNIREIGASVIFNYREGCYFFIDMIPETHADYNEVSTLRERGEKEKNISVGNTNGVYFDSINVCSPPICPETLVRTIYIYKENNLFRIIRYATKDNHELECIDTFGQILSTFKFIDSDARESRGVNSPADCESTGGKWFIKPIEGGEIWGCRWPDSNK